MGEVNGRPGPSPNVGLDSQNAVLMDESVGLADEFHYVVP